MKKNKYMIFFVALAVVSLSVIVYSSFAFFTATDTVKNTLALGKIKINLDEPNWDDVEKGKDLIPGKTLIKDPTLTEVEGVSYSRLVLEFLDENMHLITDQSRVDAISKLIYYDTSYNVNDDDYTTRNLIEGSSYSLSDLSAMIAGEKVYSLYNMDSFIMDYERSTFNRLVFKVNDKVSINDKFVLFTNIVVPVDYTNTEMNTIGAFYLRVSAEAIQTDGFDSPTDAFIVLDRDGGR